ncbi:MAG: NAD(P)/FAD-dependent oxidoreductase [Micromonosporaceae bacterium]
MRRRIVILGAGTGGTLMANRLRRSLDERTAEIVVIDQDDDHLYQPGLLLLPFGMARADRLVKPRHRQLRPGIAFRRGSIESVALDRDEVRLSDGATVSYDVLIVASGTTLLPEETEGLTGPGWMEKVFTFYDLEGARALKQALARFDGGRLAVNVVDMPIKCPVAPIEFSFLADWYFRKRGIRDKVEITLVTPLDGAFTKPVCNRELSGLLTAKGIGLVTEFNTGEVDGQAGRLVSFDGREVGFDLGVVVPLHGGAPYVGRSPGLGDELGFVPTDERTLQSKARPNVFVIGDAADIPTSKAGSVAHFEGEVLTRNIERFMAGEPLDATFDGHTNCFIESGFGKALLIDFNYDTQPMTGHFPGRAGLPLLRESRLNHLGKLLFAQFYWHGLLPGREVPGVTSRMPTSGKRMP